MKIIVVMLLLNFIIPQLNHAHNHKHNNELGMAIGLVPGHENEDSSIGLHLHYIKGFGQHNDFGIGISLETILDEHQHNSVSIIGTYHLKNGFTIAYAPGILLEEHEEDTEYKFTQHFEFYYEFELESFHIGPQFDIGFEGSEIHYMLGIHFGIDL